MQKEQVKIEKQQKELERLANRKAKQDIKDQKKIADRQLRERRRQEARFAALHNSAAVSDAVPMQTSVAAPMSMNTSIPVPSGFSNHTTSASSSVLGSIGFNGYDQAFVAQRSSPNAMHNPMHNSMHNPMAFFSAAAASSSSSSSSSSSTYSNYTNPMATPSPASIDSNNNRSSGYKCKRCGLPKKGHVCLNPSPLASSAPVVVSHAPVMSTNSQDAISSNTFIPASNVPMQHSSNNNTNYNNNNNNNNNNNINYHINHQHTNHYQVEQPNSKRQKMEYENGMEVAAAAIPMEPEREADNSQLFQPLGGGGNQDEYNNQLFQPLGGGDVPENNDDGMSQLFQPLGEY